MNRAWKRFMEDFGGKIETIVNLSKMEKSPKIIKFRKNQRARRLVFETEHDYKYNEDLASRRKKDSK